eukprot:1476849-Pleurochrysis_carterae.AAC.1
MRCTALLWHVPPPPLMAPEVFRGGCVGAMRGLFCVSPVAIPSSVVTATTPTEFVAYPFDYFAEPSASASSCGGKTDTACICHAPRRMFPVLGSSARNSRRLFMKQSQKRDFMGAAADRPLAKQSLGQNFLSDEAAARRIVA